MSQAADVIRRALPQPDALILEKVEQTERGVVLLVRIDQPPRCPACASTVVSRHSAYTCTLRDLPWQGQPVTIRLQTRRFRCRSGQCSQQVFAERLPGLAGPRARETRRRSQILRLVGYTLGGKPGSKVRGAAERSPPRLLRAQPDDPSRESDLTACPVKQPNPAPGLSRAGFMHQRRCDRKPRSLAC